MVVVVVVVRVVVVVVVRAVVRVVVRVVRVVLVVVVLLLLLLDRLHVLVHWRRRRHRNTILIHLDGSGGHKRVTVADAADVYGDGDGASGGAAAEGERGWV